MVWVIGEIFREKEGGVWKKVEDKKGYTCIYRYKVNVDKMWDMYAQYNNRRLWLEGCKNK